MASTTLCFQVHQPDRLRHYTIFDNGDDYFDGFQNAEICRRVSRSSYLPANRLLLELLEECQGRFKVAFSMTGVLLEQLHDHAPEVLESFQALADTGCVEFLAQSYYHSLSLLYSTIEFSEQVEAHRALIRQLFGQTPRVFRNTERLYSNTLAETIERIGGFDAILIDTPEAILGQRSPNFIYGPPKPSKLKLLVKNSQLSDDIAFRFASRSWSEWPLQPEKYARWLNGVPGNAATVNLCIDYETLGEHQRAETGIFDFIRRLPGEVLKHPCGDFKTPSEAAAYYQVLDLLDVSDAPREKITAPDLAAWLGNVLQQDAATQLYQLEPTVKATRDQEVLTAWRKLQTRDHLSYMSMQLLQTGDQRPYATPYDCPYDSYINFMNVLDSLKTRCAALCTMPEERQTSVV